MDLGNKMYKLYDIGTLERCGEAVTRAFLFLDLLQDVIYVPVLLIVQLVYRPAVMGQQEADMLQGVF